MASPPVLTDNDRKVLVNAWQCFKTQPVVSLLSSPNRRDILLTFHQVDYVKLQELANYKTVASANTCYLAARKKLFANDGAKMTDNDRKLIVLAW